MPKDRRTRCVSFERHLHSPYPCHSTHQKHSSSSSRQSTEPATSEADIKEWEDARCPVCMEHPHNAVLLLCCSHDNGCRAYMCDTSYRHSNCLDQFRKATSNSAPCPESRGDRDPVVKLSCPLCRGVVEDWIVVEPARKYMNVKSRICSLESCGYSGTYGELRKHARMEHPSARPSDADPERQRNWSRMEHQRDMGDLLRTILPLFVDDEVAGAGNDGETGMSMFSSPGFYVYLRIQLHHQQEDTTAASHPQVFVTFRPRSETMRNQRRSHTNVGETFDGDLGSSGRDVHDADEEDSPIGRLISTFSQRARTRHRRQMRMPNEEDAS